MAIANHTIPALTPQDLDRFWDKVTQIPDGCWPWHADTDKDGYGRLTICRNGSFKVYRSHRLSYFIQHGIDPAEQCVLHRCDNPPCVNPDHLFLGTVIDNNADTDKKGRRATGDRQGKRLHPERYPQGDDHHARKNPACLARGSRHGLAKLTEADVVVIRSRYAEGHVTYSQLAAKYGVSKNAIFVAVKHIKWKHVL